MAEPIYISKVYIERRYGPVRIAHLPAEEQPVTFSVHPALANYCDSEVTRLVPPHASTLDYVVAAAGASLIDAFGSALERERIDASHGRLTAEVRGEIGTTDDGVVIITKIEIEHHVMASELERQTIHEVHASYLKRCALFRTLSPSVEFISSYRMMAESAPVAEKKPFLKLGY